MPELTTADFAELSAYLDNELTAAERAALERRLSSDEDLAAALADLRVVQAATQALPPLTAPRDFRLDPNLYTAKTYQLAAAPRPDQHQQPAMVAPRPVVRRRYRWASAVSAVAAILVMACGLLVVLGGSFNAGMMSAPMMLNSVENQQEAEVAFDATAYQEAAATGLIPPEIATTATGLTQRMVEATTTYGLFFAGTAEPGDDPSARTGTYFGDEAPAPLPDNDTGTGAAGNAAVSELAEEPAPAIALDAASETDDLALGGAAEGIAKTGEADEAIFAMEEESADDGADTEASADDGTVESVTEAEEVPAIPADTSAEQAPAEVPASEQQEDRIADAAAPQPGMDDGGEPPLAAAPPETSTHAEAPSVAQSAAATPTAMPTQPPSPTAALTATPPPVITLAEGNEVTTADRDDDTFATGLNQAGIGLLLLGSGGFLLALAWWFYWRSRREE